MYMSIHATSMLKVFVFYTSLHVFINMQTSGRIYLHRQESDTDRERGRHTHYKCVYYIDKRASDIEKSPT